MTSAELADFAVNEKTASSVQTCISERDTLWLLPSAGDRRWGLLYFPPWSRRNLLAPDGVHGLHILPPMWKERADRSGAQGKGGKTGMPHPCPHLTHSPHLPFQGRNKHVALRGPIPVETVVSEKWGERPAQVDAATWNLLSLDSGITDVHDVIIVVCRAFTFPGLRLTEKPEGLPSFFLLKRHRSQSGLQTPLLNNNNMTATMTVALVECFLCGGGGAY